MTTTTTTRDAAKGGALERTRGGERGGADDLEGTNAAGDEDDGGVTRTTKVRERATAPAGANDDGDDDGDEDAGREDGAQESDDATAYERQGDDDDRGEDPRSAKRARVDEGDSRELEGAKRTTGGGAEGLPGTATMRVEDAAGTSAGARAPPADKVRQTEIDAKSIKNVPSTLLDEAERKLRRPRVNATEVYRLLEAHYDLGTIDKDSMKELPSYDDKNWYFRASRLNASGKKVFHEYVVKVHNGTDSSGVNRGVLAAQERVMTHLMAHGVECPRVVKSKLTMYTTPGPNGTVNLVPEGTEGAKREFCTRVTFLSRAQIAHTLRVLTYVPGKTLAEVPMPHSMEFVRKSGLFVGETCHVLTKWPTPKELEIHRELEERDPTSLAFVEQHAMCWKVLASRARLWDLRHFMDVQHFMTDLVMRGLFKDDARLRMCNTVFNAYKHLVLPVEDKLRVGIIHGDMNEQNMLAHKSGADPVVHPNGVKFAVIDFGDVVVSWRVNEVAIALAYCALDKDDPLHDMSIMLAGIQSVFPLTPLEMRILPCLIAARLVTSLIMGMYSYHMQIVGDSVEVPEAEGENERGTKKPARGNEYVLTTQKSAWSALKNILTVGAETIFKRFVVCTYSET